MHRDNEIMNGKIVIFFTLTSILQYYYTQTLLQHHSEL